ncbi:MAG: hypothetical protein WC766_03395 [Patescibacteria group bacterium]
MLDRLLESQVAFSISVQDATRTELKRNPLVARLVLHERMEFVDGIHKRFPISLFFGHELPPNSEIHTLMSVWADIRDTLARKMHHVPGFPLRFPFQELFGFLAVPLRACRLASTILYGLATFIRAVEADVRISGDIELFNPDTPASGAISERC